MDDRGTLLTGDEYDRLVYLLSLLNDLNVTQLDTDEASELRCLLYKITNDGDDYPLTPEAPKRGERVIIDGEQYLVTRVTIQSKNAKTDAGSKAARLARPTRAQIDLMPSAEAERRIESLRALLEGNPTEDGEE